MGILQNKLLVTTSYTAQYLKSETLFVRLVFVRPAPPLPSPFNHTEYHGKIKRDRNVCSNAMKGYAWWVFTVYK